MYITFQYQTISCIPATGHVYNISIPDSFMYTCYRYISRNNTSNLFWTVADILQHIPSKVPDIDCSWHAFHEVLYLGKIYVCYYFSWKFLVAS